MRVATRSTRRILLPALAVASLLAGTAGCGMIGDTDVAIFTGGTAGVYFPLGSKYAELLNAYSDNIDARAVTSGASVTNANAIGRGDCEAGFIQNDISFYASRGMNMFGAAIPELRGIACLYPETMQFVVKADSPIMSLQDMAGKTVAVGAPGSGTVAACEQILTAAGVWDTTTRFHLNFAEAVSALKLGEVDAGFVVAGAPTPAIEELAVSDDVRIIDIPDAVLSQLVASGYPFYVRQVIPAGTYDMDAQCATAAVQAMLCVRSSVPEDVVYDMTKILFTRLDELRSAHAKASEITLEAALVGMSLVLHPGAVKYYQEVGVSVPAALLG